MPLQQVRIIRSRAPTAQFAAQLRVPLGSERTQHRYLSNRRASSLTHTACTQRYWHAFMRDRLSRPTGARSKATVDGSRTAAHESCGSFSANPYTSPFEAILPSEQGSTQDEWKEVTKFIPADFVGRVAVRARCWGSGRTGSGAGVICAREGTCRFGTAYGSVWRRTVHPRLPSRQSVGPCPEASRRRIEWLLLLSRSADISSRSVHVQRTARPERNSRSSSLPEHIGIQQIMRGK